MKRLAVLLFGLLLVFGAVPTYAVAPYTTWTLAPGGFFTPTQDAYTPLAEIILPVSSPEEMFLAPNGFIYIADTGNGRIVKLNSDFEIIAEFGSDILVSPTGIFVDEEGTLYIADAGTNTIVILNSDGELINQFGRPTEPLFGANRQFRPRKIAVDARQNLYIVNEGSVDGLVIMNTSGNFIGYFGANEADMSLKMILQRMFLTDEQLSQFIRNEAASPSNLAIDDHSLVYTITTGSDPDTSIHKFNVSGRNLFPEFFGSNSFRDIHVSEDGLVTAVSAEGAIYEYDLNGVLLFVFGGQDRGDQRLGLLRNPTSIERVGDNLYVLDKDKNAIVIYQVTDFARTLHSGVSLYTEGRYDEARPFFEEVLDFNGLVLIAYEAIAVADFMDGNYADALDYYRYANNRRGYSESFWELRNVVIQQSLGSVLGLLCGGWLVLGVFTRLDRRRGWLDPLRAQLRRLQKIRLIDDFAFMFRFIRQPADSFYYIKQNLRGSLWFAFIIFAWVLAVRVLSLYLTGFVFSPYANAWQIQVETELIYTIVPIAIWIVASYLVATITDGEGHFRHVVIGTAYSLFPYALLMLPLTLLSNLLTFNEVFIFTFSSQLILYWIGIMLFIMVKEIHNYTVSETIMNILTTLFTMAMFLLTAYILYVLFNQLYEFVWSILQEIRLRG
ncbi:MAG: YIP1 family protein [Anaerolineae bacterium]|nr:YIP1 family protein [Anaerolineae bacterium]